MIASRAEAPPVRLAIAPIEWLDPIPHCLLCGGTLEATGASERRCDRCSQRYEVIG